MPAWDAEVAIDEQLVRALLTTQFPELDAESARFLGEGWDNSVWIVEERWAFRFPRRQLAVSCTRRELAVLPSLAPLLPVPVPAPAFVGQPCEPFGWPFFGAALLPGRELADAGIVAGDRDDLGTALGLFLRVLHGPGIRSQVDPDHRLPVDPNGRADMAIRVPRARECLAELESTGVWRTRERIEDILDEASRLESSEDYVLVHGDLHVRHVLVEGGRLRAVIDWGDVCVGDPSIDLHLVWSLLPPAGRERFVDAYGPIGNERLLRARVAALYFCAMLAAYAHTVGYASLERESLAGLERTLVD